MAAVSTDAQGPLQYVEFFRMDGILHITTNSS
ncbi:hypothetical protein T11_15639 [Trichinella zimbabwensis]|uniref:Uncharacterized protein n=1 Tax=Trichinella zimbabwensis TaxID=268475 RepID=A0A0V1F4D9_9BILA|nr:hypothetical protein T11_15639 [Trichinella zimbabwensis]